MSALFEVEITIRAVIVADDSDHAISVADDCAREIVREDDLSDIYVSGQITKAGRLPDGWDVKCLPYGGDGSTSIETFLAELPPPPPERDTKTVDMFAGSEA